MPPQRRRPEIGLELQTSEWSDFDVDGLVAGRAGSPPHAAGKAPTSDASVAYMQRTVRVAVGSSALLAVLLDGADECAQGGESVSIDRARARARRNVSFEVPDSRIGEESRHVNSPHCRRDRTRRDRAGRECSWSRAVSQRLPSADASRATPSSEDASVAQPGTQMRAAGERSAHGRAALPPRPAALGNRCSSGTRHRVRSFRVRGSRCWTPGSPCLQAQARGEDARTIGRR